ncbi:hypothetical protein [Natrinema sp. DC36]|uniref:hypothetical protein n=1 Tax=Natrinema sp. DC36 TaxID=2878680 RepID=UPI001CF0130F|nr:hypothetical protein [Natrinema sp. DC36]
MSHRVTAWTFEHADVLLLFIGMFVAFTYGAVNLSLRGAVFLTVFTGLFTLFIQRIERI